jgi:hypothetical protein
MKSNSTHRLISCLRNVGAAILLLGLSSSPSMAQNQPPATGTTDDVLAAVGNEVPAFGGMFVDDDADTLYVYLVPNQLGNVAQVDQALSDVFGNDRPTEHQIVALQGQYTFLQLKQWRDLLSPAVLSVPGTYVAGIDSAKNRLRVGVESSAIAPAIDSFLASKGIPADAVDVEVTSPPMIVSTTGADDDSDEPADEKTLRSFFRPVLGGLQIEIAFKGLQGVNICTLGFVATRDDKPGIVTNDHCKKDYTNPPLNVFYQPTVEDANRIATGKLFPDYFRTKQNPKCTNEERFCRYSDTAFATLDKKNGSQGMIARPAAGSDQWDGTDTFSIVAIAAQGKELQGKSVTRVSSQTGRDSGGVPEDNGGKIDYTCQDMAQWEKKGGDGRKQDTLITMLCQVSVKWKGEVKSGDSGSPVFITNDKNNDVEVVGILWGDTGVSPMSNILMTTEMGPTLQVCIAGKKC